MRWLAEGFLPWQASGGLTVIVTAYPDRFAALLPELQRRFGPVGMAVAARADIETAVLAACGARLAFPAKPAPSIWTKAAAPCTPTPCAVACCRCLACWCWARCWRRQRFCLG